MDQLIKKTCEVNNMIPSYLKEIANDVKVKNDSTKFTLKCRCGCEDFYLFKKERSKEDKKNENIMLKYLVKKISKKNKIEEIDGKLYYVKKNIFGKITKEEVEVPNVKLFKNYISANVIYAVMNMFCLMKTFMVTILFT